MRLCKPVSIVAQHVRRCSMCLSFIGMGLPGTQCVVRSASRSTSARTPQSVSTGGSRGTIQAGDRERSCLMATHHEQGSLAGNNEKEEGLPYGKWQLRPKNAEA